MMYQGVEESDTMCGVLDFVPPQNSQFYWLTTVAHHIPRLSKFASLSSTPGTVLVRNTFSDFGWMAQDVHGKVYSCEGKRQNDFL